MKIRRIPNYLECTNEQLAAHAKYCGMDKYKAWDMYITWLALKPRIDTKEFYAIYAAVDPIELVEIIEVDFSPTHLDNLCNQRCMITQDVFGVYHIVWADGTTGSNPPTYPPDPSRFEPL